MMKEQVAISVDPSKRARHGKLGGRAPEDEREEAP